MATQAEIRKEYTYDADKGELVRIGKDKRRDPSTRKSRYSNVNVSGKSIREHRAIWIWHKGAIPAGMQIDHKDGNTHNNKIENLRLCTNSQNGMNRSLQKNNQSGYKGVRKYKDGYIAVIKVQSKIRKLGKFSSAQDAAKAYDKAALEYFGDFAKPNKQMGLI